MDFLRQTVGNLNDWIKPQVNTDSHILSKAAYDPDIYDKELTRRGFTVDPSLSNEDARVYVKDGKAHVAYRGTSKWKDLLPDLDILRGKRKHSDFDAAVEVAKRAKSKYGDVRVTGHSLGGTKALHAAENLDLAAEVYNPGTTPFKKQKVNNEKITVYKNPLDPISYGVTGKSVKWWRNPFKRNPHGL